MKQIVPFLFVSALAVGAMTAAPAHAGTDPFQQLPTRVVRIAGLDLAQPADQDKLLVRIERAARRICRTESTIYKRDKCAAEAVAYTMERVSPEVRRAYAAASDRHSSFALAQN